MAAALTYYTMLSLAPTLIIAIAIAGYLFGDQLAETQVLETVQQFTTEDIARTVAGLIDRANRPDSGVLAGSISIAILVIGASGAFTQIYNTFNMIWQVADERTGILYTIQNRLIGIAMVLVVGLLLIVALVLHSVIASINQWVEEYPAVLTWLNLSDRSLSFLLMPVIFSLMFWFFPATKISIRDVLPAGVLTSLLVAGSRYLIQAYLQFSTTSEVYGAAGSLVVLLIWIYITSLVVFLGAAFSHAWANVYGSRSEQALTNADAKEQPRAEQELPGPPRHSLDVEASDSEDSPLIPKRRTADSEAVQ